MNLVCLNILILGYPTNRLTYVSLFRFLILGFLLINFGSFITKYFISLYPPQICSIKCD
jgi:hypothetical protein